MFLQALGLLLAASHVLTIALIILWFGLRKPTSKAEFWHRFRQEFLSVVPAEPSRRKH